MREEGLGHLIYLETIPDNERLIPRLNDTTGRFRRVETRISGALLLIGIAFLIAIALNWGAGPDLTNNYFSFIAWICLIIGISTMAYLFYTQEMRSRTMIRFYEKGAIIYSSPFQKICGFDGIILKGNVKDVVVQRGYAAERLGKDEYLTYNWGETGLKFRMKDSSHYEIGNKPLKVVQRLILEIKNSWSIEPLDSCDGPGQIAHYRKGKRIS